MSTGPESVSPTIWAWRILSEDHSDKQDNDCLVERVANPRPENPRAKQFFLDSNSIQVWLIKEPVSLVLKVHDSPVEADNACEAHIVELVDPSFIQGLSAEH